MKRALEPKKEVGAVGFVKQSQLGGVTVVW
jgi:hypothetical protein